jgi:hypothetical protein
MQQVNWYDLYKIIGVRLILPLFTFCIFAILDFFKNLFYPQNLRLTNIKCMQKEYWKNVGYSQSYVKKSDFEPPFWMEPPFCIIWQNMLLILVAN